jgi:hypothetical protein
VNDDRDLPPIEYSNPTTPPPPEPDLLEAPAPRIVWIAVGLFAGALLVALIGVLLQASGSDRMGSLSVLVCFCLMFAATVLAGLAIIKAFAQYFGKK